MDIRQINEKYTEIGFDLISTEPSLQSIKESSAQIIFLSSQHKKVASGKYVFGVCEKIADKYKWGIPCDFTITVFQPNVDEFHFTDEQVRALIHHELLHVGVEKTDDDTEKFFIVPHDIEDFRLILDLYGVNWDQPKQGE